MAVDTSITWMGELGICSGVCIPTYSVSFLLSLREDCVMCLVQTVGMLRDIKLVFKFCTMQDGWV